MSDIVDLATPVQDAVFLALAAAFAGGPERVLQHVPQDINPAAGPLIILGDIESENAGGKGEQAELFGVDVQLLYRGKDRRVLLALVHRVRVALEDQPIGELVDGAALAPPVFSGSAISQAGKDGVTYAAGVAFEIFAEPV